MSDRELDELTIQNYIYELNEPRSNQPRSIFEQRSYSIWAANELLKEVRANDSTPPIIVIEEFISKMNNYSRLNPHAGRIFSIAYDTAQDILDVFMTTI